MSESSLLVQRTQRAGTGYQIQLRETPFTGAPRVLATIVDAPVPSVHVDARGGRVLLTRDENGVHNLYAVALRDGAVVKITNNETPGLSFSGIQSLRGEVLVYAREERKRDIWLVQRRAAN